MTTDQRGRLPGLSSRANNEYQRLLQELEACGFQSQDLLQRAGLPSMAQRPLFTLLGYVCRADGRVTEQDIQLAESLMRAQAFSRRRRNLAIAAFRAGKAMESIPSNLGRRLRWLAGGWPGPSLKVALVLCHASQSKGQVSMHRLRRTEEAIRFLGLPTMLPQQVMDRYRERHESPKGKKQSDLSYEEACRILGATARDSFETLKMAYRRSVGQYHPDRLDPDLSPAARAAAKDQMLQLQAAWQRVRFRHQARS